MKTQHTRLQHTTKYEQQLYKEWISPIYTIDDCINRIPIADQSQCSVLQSRMSRYEGRFINLRLAFAIGSHLKNRRLSSESQTHQNAGKMRRSRWSQPHGTISATVCSRMLLCNCEFTPGFFEVTWILACQVNPVGMQGCFNSCSMKTKTRWKPTALHGINNEWGSPLGRLYDCIWNSSLQSFKFWFKQLNFK